jgi:sugar/nucleoside kinase (ribokinase family)
VARDLAPPPRICVVGDLVLDVIAQLHAPLAAGDDVPARTQLQPGGQAANVAAWAAHLGARARCVAPRGGDDAGRILAAELAARDVELVGPAARRTGIVVSLVGADRDRSMASDRGEPAGLQAADLDAAWFAGQDVVHVSGYLLARDAGGRAAAVAAAHARAPRSGLSPRPAGAEPQPRAASASARTLVTLDVSSAALVEQVGAAVFRERVRAVAPDVLFATEAELAALADGGADAGSTAPVVVVKRGADGCSVRADGAERHLPAVAATAVDATGAGDAFAAGFLVGGPQLALEAGARCVAGVGAMP